MEDTRPTVDCKAPFPLSVDANQAFTIIAGLDVLIAMQIDDNAAAVRQALKEQVLAYDRKFNVVCSCNKGPQLQEIVSRADLTSENGVMRLGRSGTTIGGPALTEGEV